MERFQSACITNSLHQLIDVELDDTVNAAFNDVVALLSGLECVCFHFCVLVIPVTPIVSLGHMTKVICYIKAYHSLDDTSKVNS